MCFEYVLTSLITNTWKFAAPKQARSKTIDSELVENKRMKGTSKCD